MKRYDQDNNAMLGLIIAGTVAAAAAIVLGGTDHGRRVRHRTGARAEELKEQARVRAQELKEQARDRAADLRVRADEVREEAKDAMRRDHDRAGRSNMSPAHSLFEALGLLRSVGRDVDRIQFVMSDGSVRELDPRKLDENEVRFLLGKSSRL